MLWEHQRQAIDLARDTLINSARGRLLVRIPPGTGKTEIAVRIAVEWVHSGNLRKCLVCVPNTRILGQFYSRLVALTPIRVGIEQAGRTAEPSARIVLASQLSLIHRMSKYGQDVLCIIDEAHHSNFDAPKFLTVVRAFDRVLGLTATPWSSGCSTIFGDSQRFFLSLADAQRLQLACELDVLPWDEPHGPFGLVFCESNRECQQQSERTLSSDWIGVNRTDALNLSAVMRWQSMRIGLLFVNRMLLEGFDSKPCARIWINRSTYSDILLSQMCGRALRYQTNKRASIYCMSDAVMGRVTSALKRLDDAS